MPVWTPKIAPVAFGANDIQNLSQKTVGNDKLGFKDFVDMINPLQHIPFVGSVYRYITGDEIKPVSRLVGGAAFGGPIGFATSAVSNYVEYKTGSDLEHNVLAYFGYKPELDRSKFEPITPITDLADLAPPPADSKPRYNL
jgi:hypothetical protein